MVYVLLLPMDHPSVRADAYAKRFTELIQSNGFRVFYVGVQPTQITLYVDKSGMRRGYVCCYRNRDACLVRTTTYPLTTTPFNITREDFIDCSVFHWTVKTVVGTFHCGFCCMMLPDEDVPCFRCYHQRRDLMSLRRKGLLLVLCRNSTHLIPDVINCIVRRLADITGDYRLNMMKTAR